MVSRAGLETGASDISREQGVDGTGVVVAVVGSGIDPGHPDLQVSSAGGLPKLTDWMDFTSEGLVRSEPAPSSGGWVDSRFGRLRTGGIRSQSGTFRVGMLREADLPPDGALRQDLNGNGATGDTFPVLIVDPVRRGVYTRVYVDTNQDRDFTDEIPLGIYGETRSFSRFRDGSGAAPAGAVHFVCARIAPDGSEARLGFDGAGTGTFLAGLIAARSTAEGMNGIAPGASLMSLKACDSSGRCSVEAVVESLAYAGERGARVIVVDLHGEAVRPGDVDRLKESVYDAAVRYRAVVVFPAGDGGPGLQTSRAPVDGASGVAVGGAVYDGGRARVWARSAVGPTPAGGAAPGILAPVAGSSAVPSWVSRSGYALAESTSVSAAYVGGCAALVIEACGKAGLRPGPAEILGAMTEAGTELESRAAIEQGGGLVNARGTFELLRDGYDAPLTTVCEETDGYRVGGLFARDAIPGSVRFFVDNFSARPVNLVFEGAPDWIEAKERVLMLPPVGERAVHFEYRSPGPGLHSAVTRARDAESGRTLARLVHTFVQPGAVGPGETLVLEPGAELKAGEFFRRFFRVLPGATTVRLRAVNTGWEAAEIRVIGEQGKRVRSGVVAPRSEWSTDIAYPGTGTWEIVVMGEGESGTVISLELTARGLAVSPWPPEWRVIAGERNPGGAGLAFQVVNHRTDSWLKVVPSVALPDSGSMGTLSVTVPARGTFSKVFTVGRDVERLVIRVSEPSYGGADLDAYLHWFDPSAGWTEVASSATDGTSPEVVDLVGPRQGSYALYIESGEPAESQCEVSITAYRKSASVSWDREGAVFLKQGDPLQVRLALDPAKSEDENLIEVHLVETTTNRLVATLPLALVREPGLPLSVGLGQAAPDGGRYVSITVDGERFAGRRATLVVDGMTQCTGDGAVTLSKPMGGEVKLELYLDGTPAFSVKFPVEDIAPIRSKIPGRVPDLQPDPEKERLRGILLKWMGQVNP
jgi:subtilisin family serine protease